MSDTKHRQPQTLGEDWHRNYKKIKPREDCLLQLQSRNPMRERIKRNSYKKKHAPRNIPTNSQDDLALQSSE